MSDQRREQLLQAITTRASTDIAFRKRLLTAPEAAIAEAFGVAMPTDVRVRFIEKPAGIDALIVLPDVQATERELDDDDLDAAAGGVGSDDTGW